MNTNDLIASLGAELTPVRTGLLSRSIWTGIGAGVAATTVLFVLFWGVRPDASIVLRDLSLFGKTALPLMLGCLALPWAQAEARPGGKTWAAWAIWTVPVVVLIAFLATLLTTPSAGWPMAIRGKSVNTCLISIPILATPILVGLLIALRRGAPVYPARCGAAAGFIAAGFAATIYSLYCVEDSVLFYGVWYTLPTLLVGAAGAILGRFLLRW